MENKHLTKIISVFITIFILFFGLALSWWLYNFVINYPTKQNPPKSQKVEIDQTLLEKVGEQPDYGSKVTTNEPGYGRDNPFVPFKAPPVTETPATAPGTVTPSPGTTL